MRFKKDVKTCLLYGLVILLTFVNIKSMFLVTIIFALLLVWQIYLTNKHIVQDEQAEERRKELGRECLLERNHIDRKKKKMLCGNSSMKNIWKVLKRSLLILMTNMRTMKMAGRNKRTPMVVFGSDTLPNKCLVGYQEKDSKTRIIRICEMENPDGVIEAGTEDVPLALLSGEYIEMRFCRKESLQYFIAFLQKLNNAWEGEQV